MYPNFANNRIGRTTHDGLKKALISLLILSAVAGHASTLYFSIWGKSGSETLASDGGKRSLLQSLKTPKEIGAIVTENIEKFKAGRVSGVRDLFRQPTEPEGTLHSFTFQGTLSSQKGAIAMINDQPVAVDAEIDGIRIVTISDSNVILEYQGSTKKVRVGETVSVYIQD